MTVKQLFSFSEAILLSATGLILLLNICFINVYFEYYYLGISYFIASLFLFMSTHYTIRTRKHTLFTIMLCSIILVNLSGYLFLKFYDFFITLL